MLTFNHVKLSEGKALHAGELGHAAGGRGVHLAQRLVHGRDYQVLEHLDVLGVDRLGVDGEARELVLAADDGLDNAAAGGRCV